mgnify:CR=1 FL=1
MTERPWWIWNGETNRKVRYANYETAKAAGLRAYDKLVASGKYAEDTYVLISMGEIISIAAIATARETRE